MKRQQKFITSLSLIAALSGMSSAVSADAGGPSSDVRTAADKRAVDHSVAYQLSNEQMDKVNAGTYAEMNKHVTALLQYGTNYCETALCWASVMQATGATVQYYSK